MVILLGFLIVVLGLVDPYVPIQEVPKDELRVVSAMEITPVTFHQGLKNQAEFNDAHIVKQQYDYSCGSAALATLLNYYLGEQLTEKQIIAALIEYGDKQQIEKLRAFSLLDMKRFVEKLGYKGTGYKAEIEDLKALGKPCIVPVEIFGYSHFCVFRGIFQDHVFLADPYLGNVSYSVADFRKMWQRNVAFVVTNGEITNCPLMLKEDDLRFVSLDATRHALNMFNPPSAMMEHLRIDNAMGVRPTAR